MTDASTGYASKPPTWEDARNLLCVRLDSLGDVLMTTPAIRALKEAAPDRRITLLTSPSGAPAARLAPEIDEVIVYEAPWMKHSRAPASGAAPVAPEAEALREYAMAERLRSRNFDAAVIFTVYSQNPLPAAFLCYLAGIPLRLAHCRENPYQLLTNWVKDVEPEQNVRHEVRRQLDLAAAVGAQPEHERLSVHVSPAAAERVATLLSAAGLDLERPWLVLHPGATAASRRYPPEQYAVVARRLIEEAGLQVVFTGSTAEIELVDEIRSHMVAASCPYEGRCPDGTTGSPWVARPLRRATEALATSGAISLAGLLDVEEMAALLQLAPLLISNNTGPVHMAAGLGTPIVVLYALTNPQHTPWLAPSKVLFQDVPCKFCYKSTCPLVHNNCLRLVAPGRVVKAALELLQASQGAGGSPIGAQNRRLQVGRLHAYASGQPATSQPATSVEGSEVGEPGLEAL